MIIFVRTLTGHTSELEVDPSDTIENVASMIQHKDGIPVSEQCYVYSGKRLNSERTLASYDIQNGSSLHVLSGFRNNPDGLRDDPDGLKDDPDEQSTGDPMRTAFPTRQEAFQRIYYWKSLAGKGSFDADTHIMDPHAHYEALDSIQQMTVKSSELYRQSGVYHLDCTWEVSNLQHLVSRSAPQRINNLVLNLQEGDSVTNGIFYSLCETYFIVDTVIGSFNRLESIQFCASFFSILVERCNGTVAEIVKIRKESLLKLRDSLEVAMVIIRANSINLESVDKTVMDCIRPAVQEFLDVLNCEQLGSDVLIVNTLPDMLNLYRVVACVLDLGLVSYVGSHAARFDTETFQQEMSPLRFDLPNNLSFECNLRGLACLDGFLDAKLVWVFRVGVNVPSTNLKSNNGKQKRLLILTTIDAFADIWGSVWAEAEDYVAADERRVRVKKYHVSKGVIRRVREDSEPLIQGAVKCHWYSWKQDYRRRFSSLLSKPDDLTMAVDDNLLIGNKIQINHGCTYSLQEYEMSYSDMISSLGTRPSAWKLDSVAMAVQLSAPKIVAFQIQGNVKKVPETTVKQSLWTKWSL